MKEYEYDLCEAVSYADEEHAEADDQTKVRKVSPRRQQQQEKEFLELYELFIHPPATMSQFRFRCLVDDLLNKLYELSGAWAYRKAAAYRKAGFLEAEAEDALSTGYLAVYQVLSEDKAKGFCCEYPIAYYLRIYHNKTIDLYFRPLASRMTQESVATQDPEDMDDEQVRKELGLKVRKRKKTAIVSMDAPVARDVKTTLGQLLEDPTKDVFRLLYDSAEQHAQSAQALFEIFLQELMDYNDEPQKPLALMYGSVLFKLAKEYGGDSPLAQEAKKSTKVASPIWAHKRMGNANLSALSAYAQRVVRYCCEESLCWGDTFRQNLRSRDTAGTGLLWGDIIYTRTYTEAQTSNWIESIRKSTMVKCARRVEKDTALVAFAKEQLHHDNKFRKALEKAEKEER